MPDPKCPRCDRVWTNHDVCTLYTLGECNGCGRMIPGSDVSEILRLAATIDDEVSDS